MEGKVAVGSLNLQRACDEEEGVRLAASESWRLMEVR
jgi:hypothetical protein